MKSFSGLRRADRAALELIYHNAGFHYFLAAHVATSFRRFLIFNKDCRNTQIVVRVDSMDYAFFVTIAVIAIHQHRQVGCMHNIPHNCRFFSKASHIHVRKAEAHAIQSETADLVGRKARLLDQLRRECIAR